MLIENYLPAKSLNLPDGDDLINDNNDTQNKDNNFHIIVKIKNN